MLTGISTACFYPQYTEDSLRRLADMHIPCAEVFVNAAGELEAGYLRELKAIADGSGIIIPSLHPYASGMEPMYFFSQYDRRFQEGLEVYRRFFQAAATLGAKLLVFHGHSRFGEMEMEEYCLRFQRVRELGFTFGVELCQENVERCMANDHSFFNQMRKLLPDAGFVLDVKQAVRAKQDVFQLAAAMGENIRHLHISDHDLFHSCMVPGAGQFDFGKLMRQLRFQNFRGSGVLELYQQNFNSNSQLARGYQHIVDLVSNI